MTRRLNDSVLQGLERPALAWLAARMPRRVTSDALTAVGLIGALMTFISYALSSRHAGFLWLASAGLVLNWFGDSLDGTLARVRRTERPRYGFFVDHTIDLLSQIAIAIGLGLSSYVRFEVACLALIAYLTMATFTFIRANVRGSLQIAFLGIGPSEVRCAMLLLNASMFFVPPRPVVTFWAPLSATDLAITAGSVVTLVLFVMTALREASHLRLEDPLPPSRAGRSPGTRADAATGDTAAAR